MKAAALICVGGVTQTFVARMPALVASLGTVKATSYRVARRIVNVLRAGRAVEDYASLAGAEAIWVVVPESALDRVIAEIPREIPAILCGTPRASATFGLDCAATLDVMPPDERSLVAEGDARAIRYLHRVAAADRRRLMEIECASKPLFLAGINLATHIALPWIAAAVESLRAAGFSRIEATRVVEQLGGRALRSYRKAGAKAWSPAAESELRRALASTLPDPRFAALYRTGIEHALEFFR
jgi:hypothetical protein